MAKKYDVALSFASEDREYVRAVALALQAASIKVFYDEFEEVNLWGKNLYNHLGEIYRNEADFCVIFISKYYLKKVWTNHERENAQARALQNKEEYILPVRFDSTDIPGLLSTIKYIELKNISPDKLAQLIIEKVINTSSNIINSNENLAKDKILQTSLKISSTNNYKPENQAISNRKKILKQAKNLKPKTKTVNFNLEGIYQLPNDKPVVYKILTQGGRNNYTGAAKKGEIYTTIQKHLQPGKNYVPGSKVKIERMNTIQEAQEKADRIKNIRNPKYNK